MLTRPMSIDLHTERKWTVAMPPVAAMYVLVVAVARSS